MAATTTTVWSPSYLKAQLAAALLNPIRAFRPRYLPLLMVYFAYGALGLIAVAESFWVKKALTLSPAELAELDRLAHAAVDREDGVRRARRRRADLRLAAPLLRVHRRGLHRGRPAAARRRGGRLAHLREPGEPLPARRLLSVLGVVIQDVAADAMSTEVVDRENPDGTPARQGRGRPRARHGAGAGAAGAAAFSLMPRMPIFH